MWERPWGRDLPCIRDAEVPPTLRCLHPAAQHFRHAPCLRDAATGDMRFARIEHFTDRTQTGIAKMDRKSFKKLTCALFVIWMYLQPGRDKRTDEPRPDRALMISAITGAEIARINRFVFRIVR